MPDSSPASNAWVLEAIGVRELHTDGWLGQGTRVAIVDTGYEEARALMHLLDGDDANGEIMAFKDFRPLNDRSLGGHATSILSVMAGWPGQDPANVERVATPAPHASYYVAAACTSTCNGTAVANAIEWAGTQEPHLMLLSLGGAPLGTTGDERPVAKAIEAVVGRGTLVVAAAGNRGPESVDVDFPASLPDVLAVGAVKQGGEIANFSSSSSEAVNGCRIVQDRPVGRCWPDQKPEMVAPGEGVPSPLAPNQYLNGTSYAAALAVGALAALQSSCGPDFQITKEVALGADSRREGHPEHDNRRGYGAIDVTDPPRCDLTPESSS